jgi:hypothetical protein
MSTIDNSRDAALRREERDQRVCDALEAVTLEIVDRHVPGSGEDATPAELEEVFRSEVQEVVYGHGDRASMFASMRRAEAELDAHLRAPRRPLVAGRSQPLKRESRPRTRSGSSRTGPRAARFGRRRARRCCPTCRARARGAARRPSAWSGHAGLVRRARPETAPRTPTHAGSPQAPTAGHRRGSAPRSTTPQSASRRPGRPARPAARRLPLTARRSCASACGCPQRARSSTPSTFLSIDWTSGGHGLPGALPRSFQVTPDIPDRRRATKQKVVRPNGRQPQRESARRRSRNRHLASDVTDDPNRNSKPRSDRPTHPDRPVARGVANCPRRQGCADHRRSARRVRDHGG